MEYSQNRLTLMPHEISIMFGEGGFTPPKLEVEPQVNWDGIAAHLAKIRATKNRTNLAVLRSFGGDENVPADDPDLIILGLDANDDSIRQVPLGLSVLAERALAKEQELVTRYRSRYGPGKIAVRQGLVDSLRSIVDNPKKVVLEVYCPEYPDQD